MKKKMGIERALEVVPVSELESLSTKALLARLKRLQWCEESLGLSDMTAEETETVSHMILFKSDKRWQDAYREIKAILATREHVSKKP